MAILLDPPQPAENNTESISIAEPAPALLNRGAIFMPLSSS
jgi:hypothetical protein